MLPFPTFYHRINRTAVINSGLELKKLARRRQKFLGKHQNVVEILDARHSVLNAFLVGPDPL